MTDFWIGRKMLYCRCRRCVSIYRGPNAFIRTQHGDLFAMIRKLRKAVKRHILDEEALLDMRERQSQHHMDVTKKATNTQIST